MGYSSNTGGQLTGTLPRWLGDLDNLRFLCVPRLSLTTIVAADVLTEPVVGRRHCDWLGWEAPLTWV